MTSSAMSEDAFAAQVDAASGEELVALLREDNEAYSQRGTAATVRMRGWALLALGRHSNGLLYLLEELDTGADAYLAAAAARSLRSCAEPDRALMPFVVRALERFQYRDEPVSFVAYGVYATGEATDTSPVRELLATLTWLGGHALEARPAVEVLRQGLSRRLLPDWERTLAALRPPAPAGDCCVLPAGWGGGRGSSRPRLNGVVFEDHNGAALTFDDLFIGQPAIVAFFYTRCDNPMKCSLTVAKLAAVQRLLAARGLAEQIHTAAITYDSAYDGPERLKRYAEDRGVLLSKGHRVLRAVEGFDELRRHFSLGVNFVESIVNRHRVELFILNAQGRIAASYERLLWDEAAVVARASEELKPAAAPLASALALALFPKCPVCWGAYLSALGVAAVPYAPLLAALLLVNLASVWWRGRATGDWHGLALAFVGGSAILAGWAGMGVTLTLAGALWSVTVGRYSWPALPGFFRSVNGTSPR